MCIAGELWLIPFLLSFSFCIFFFFARRLLLHATYATRIQYINLLFTLAAIWKGI